MLEKELAKAYEPEEIEEKWYKKWIDNQDFRADENSDKEGYSIVIPPPNVTGSLHMGHALNNTLQDIMARIKRMQGYNVLWLPGTDHAGIATQNVVEKQLALQETVKESLGRELFVKRVWEWKEEYGGVIVNQLKRLGASCDWSRERFTMDEGLSKAVRQVFVRLYEEGLIYKGDYIINWCPRCTTALSDLEVEHEDHKGHLYHIKYPFKDGSSELIVATTRPETMLGDTAVAVNPEDERFKDLIGKEVLLPLTDRTIPVIGDSHVDMNFGTGSLKITPGHDFNDFEIGLRHSLDVISVMERDGKMNELAGKYNGMDRYECREAVINDLKSGGYFVNIEDHDHSVGHCYRCSTTVEPMISKQWFVKVKTLAEPAMEAVRDGRTRIVPRQWEKTYFEWMENIKDWCISRQIWWGHRIPAWYCECGETVVAVERPDCCPSCGNKALEQDLDVLDTWFSSSLWPFTTMGWPDDTKELKLFYSTSLLVTGFDILFFWVARMMMMGLKFMNDVPFKDVYIHALVRDAQGRKMSKSKGNVIDPLLMIEKFGTDAFRFTLAAFAAQGRDVRLSEDRIEGYRNFVNKIWNASRFALMNLKGYEGDGLQLPPSEKLQLPDRWIISRLNRTVESVTRYIDAYRFNDAASSIYQFVWHELCDWYIEMIKPALYGKEGEERKKVVQAVLARVMTNSYQILHPFMPFLTEELYSYITGKEESIMKSAFPLTEPSLIAEKLEGDMELVMGVIKAVRNIKGEMGVAPGTMVELIVRGGSSESIETVKGSLSLIEGLARLASSSFTDGHAPQGAAMSVVGDLEVYLPLKGLVDFEEEEKRLEKEIVKVEKDISFLAKKLANKDFIARAPAHVVEKDKAKYDDMKEAKEKLEASLERIKCLK
ncbi:MAG: valine--tRNA ligase [Deltaproteobacteria bacterium]|nr:valine--tRNA ligase [Deltaproteobacteria bacterium]